MMADAVPHGLLAIAEEDPRFGDALSLFEEMAAFTQRLYPEDEELGILPPTPSVNGARRRLRCG